MDNYKYYDPSTMVSPEASELARMDLDFPVRGRYWDELTDQVSFSNTEDRIDVQSTQTISTQTTQPRKISREQWDRVKQIIHERYIVKNCALKDLVPHMEKELSFVASKQQYVRKLKEWGFEKNRQNQDWSSISRALKRRRAEAGEADVYIDGRLIPSKKLKKEISRYVRPSLQTKYLDRVSVRRSASPQTPDGFIIKRHDSHQLLVSPPRSLPWFDFLDRLGILSSTLSTPVYKSDCQQILAPDALVDRINLLSNVFQRARRVPATDEEATSAQIPTYLARRLSPILVERTTGDLEEAFTRMSTAQDLFRVCMLISAYVVYLCTNGLAEESTISNFVAMLKNHELGETFLRQLLGGDDLTSQIFTNCLLHHSVAKRDFWLLQQIAPRMKDVNVELKSCTHEGLPRTALHIAVDNGDVRAAKLLLSSGSDPDQCLCTWNVGCYRDEDCLRPTDVAVRRLSSTELIELFLDRGAKFDKKRILPSAIKRGADINLIQRLISAGALLQASTKLENNMLVYEDPMTVAIESGRVSVVRLFIGDYGYPPNARDAFDWKTVGSPDDLLLREEVLCSISPLICAILSDYDVMIDLLISAGADIDECICQCLDLDSREQACQTNFLGQWSCCEEFQDCSGKEFILSPIQAAAYMENEGLVRKLVNLGACPEPCHGTSALMYPVRAGSLSMTEFLLESGSDPNVFEDSLCFITPLMVAVAKDDLPMVELLLNHGADVDLRIGMPHAQEKLVRLYVSQNDERLRMLSRTNTRIHSDLDIGTGPHIPSVSTGILDCHLTTPPDLFEATLRDPHGINLLRVCLKGGSDPSRSIGQKGQSPLLLTMDSVCEECEEGHYELVKRVVLLLQHGSTIDLAEFLRILQKEESWRDVMEQVLLFPHCLSDPLQGFQHEIRESVESGDIEMLHQIVLRLLRIMKQQDPASQISQSLRHTLYASSFATKSIDKVAKLVYEEDCHVNSMMDLVDVAPWFRWPYFIYISGLGTHLTPLHLLLAWRDELSVHENVCHLRLRALQVLLGAGSDVNIVCAGSAGKELPTPLQLACLHGCVDEVRCLVEAGADVNAPAPSNENCKTALQIATLKGNLEMMKYLIFSGADVNAPAPSNEFGRTALQSAVFSGNLGAVEFLIDQSADVNALAGQNRGATALQYAAAYGYFRIMQVLLEAGADIDDPGARIGGRTAIEIAAENGRVDCLYHLLDKYKDRTPISEVCEKAVKYARKQGHHVIADYLSKYPSETPAST